MDLQILTATKQAALTASDCGENAIFALEEVIAALGDFDGSGESSNRINRAVDRLSARCAAFARGADAVYDNAWNIRRG